MENTSVTAFPDARAFLNRVLDSQKGCKATFPSKGAAINFRQKCYKLIAADRRANAKVYEKGSPMHGRSQYDCIAMNVVDNAVVGVATEEAAASLLQIEDL